MCGIVCKWRKNIWLLWRYFSSIIAVIMHLGQRLAKDYDGARTIAIYFIPSVLAVFWLS
jgi:hypothetical protein